MHSVRSGSKAWLAMACLLAACVSAEAIAGAAAGFAASAQPAGPSVPQSATERPDATGAARSTNSGKAPTSASGKQRAKATGTTPNPSPKHQPPRRRSVQQLMGSTLPERPPLNAEPYAPTLAAPGAEPYRPTLKPSASDPSTPDPSTPDPYRSTLTPPRPLSAPVAPQLGRCDAGGCFDTNGARYNGAVGNAVIGPQGQLCNRSGATLQCF